MVALDNYPPEVQKEMLDRILKDFPNAMNDMVFRMPRDGLWDYKKTTFDYLAPELRRCGLLPDAPWVVPAAAAMLEMFKNHHFRTSEEEADILNTAVLMAVTHPYGYGTIKSAPILVLAFRHFRGANPKTTKGRHHMAACWIEFMNSKLKLRELMKRLSAPYGLRVLHPQALWDKHMRTYHAIGDHLSPSEIAQVIPKHVDEQRLWVDTIRSFIDRFSARDPYFIPIGKDDHFKWAMRNLGTVGETVAGDIADYVYTHRTTFNHAWTIERVIDEQNRWHTRLANQQDAGAFEREHGIPFDKRLIKDDGAPEIFQVNLEWVGKTFTFRRLLSAMELYEEGKAMHHCVGSYARSMVEGTSAFYSLLDHTGQRKATLQYSRGERRRFETFDPTQWTGAFPLDGDPLNEVAGTFTVEIVYEWKLGQAKMLCNERLTPELAIVERAFSAALKEPRPAGKAVKGFQYKPEGYFKELADLKRQEAGDLAFGRELRREVGRNGLLLGYPINPRDRV